MIQTDWTPKKWARGEAILATVVEILDEREMIIRFGEDSESIDSWDSQLLRVSFETSRQLKVGEQVTLRVLEIQPLKFQYVESRNEQRRRGRIDVSI